ncbi:MAG: IS1 family transposase [Oscillospiraceae bacterium]|nr:IS1 family transposase [Oscillospiraceae bacterium]
MAGEAHTHTVEKINRLLRRYLARFARKTYCWPKSLAMRENSVLLFMNKCILIYQCLLRLAIVNVLSLM